MTYSKMSSSFQQKLSHAVILCIALSTSDCECGYRINGTSNIDTELLESDFLHIQNITLDTDWIPQAYTVPQASADGPYGKSAELRDVVSNPISDINNYTALGVDGGDAGLELLVRSGTPPGGDVPIAELSTARLDMLYGSYRAAMKMTAVAGTCSAFFWYLNNSAQIDMEFLSTPNTADTDTGASSSLSSINLVLQSPSSALLHDASQTPTYTRLSLPCDPTEAFHEYRFDWTPTSVIFFTDSVPLTTFTGPSVPQSPGLLLLSQWSHGNPLWSAGPPFSNAETLVGYVKAYFNPSNPARAADYSTRCPGGNLAGGSGGGAGWKSVCTVPDQLGGVFVDGAKPWFFTLQQSGNLAPNQTFDHEGKAAKKGGAAGRSVGKPWSRTGGMLVLG